MKKESPTLAMSAKLKRLKKPGDQFTVKNHKERQAAINAARELRKYGLLTLQIVTREVYENGKGHFKVVAI